MNFVNSLLTVIETVETFGLWKAGAAISQSLRGFRWALIVATIISLLLFIDNCILLGKAKLGWGWMFCPIMNIYKRCRMAHVTYTFWTGLITFALSVILLIIKSSATRTIGILLFLLFLLMTLIYSIIYCVKLTEAFGKRSVFSLGLIFLPLIFFSILAFGKAEYIEELKDTKDI